MVDEPAIIRVDSQHRNAPYVTQSTNSTDLELHDENLNMSWKSKVIFWLDPRRWVRAILMLDDTPHAIALGTAIGVWIALTPTVGIQMFLVLLVAFLLKPVVHFNKVAGLFAVYLSNPFTLVPIYWFNYRIGTVFFGETVSKEEFASLFKYQSFSDWVQSIQALFFTVGTPLLVGSLVVATFFGLATYPLVLRLAESVNKHREKKRREKIAH